MNRDQFISLCFIALLIFVIYQILLIFSPFFRSIFWAALFAFGVYPIYERLKTFLAGRETIAAIATTFAILLVIVPLMVLLIANIATQAVEFYQLASNYVREGSLERLINQFQSLPVVQRIQSFQADIFKWEPLKENLANWLLSSSRAITNFSVSQAGTLTKNLFFIGANLVLTAFFTFIFFKDGPAIYQFIYQIAPLEEANKEYIFNQVLGTFAAVIRGQLLVSLIQAVVAGTLFWALGLPLPIFFGIATFITALIPVIGAAGVWFPLVIYLVMLQSYVKAGILLGFGVLVISIIDNVMKPGLIGERTKLPYFLLFFGIIGGIKLYGLMGVFLAPVVLSLFFALVKIYRAKYV